MALPVPQLASPMLLETGADGATDPGMNWLKTWLGQMQAPIVSNGDNPEQSMEVPAPPRQVQWLTLLPSVPALQGLVASVEIGSSPIGMAVAEAPPKEPESEDPARQEITPLVAPPPQPGPDFAPREKPPEEDPPVAADEVQNVVVIPLTYPPPVTMLTPAPVPFATGDISSPRVSPDIRLPADPPIQPLTTQPDKGELIWAAEFVVFDDAQEPQEIREVPKTRDALRTSSGTEEKPERHGEAQPDSGHTQSEGQPPQRLPTLKPSLKRVADPSVEQPVALEQIEVGMPETITQLTSRVEFPSPAPLLANTEKTVEPIAGSIAVEPARPLRPAQVATIYVDVPAAAGTQDAAPLRLAVSQRGDQVNVRLRSWDSGAMPLENNRMDPLLQSLADQGYTAKKTSVDRPNESAPQIFEYLKEKPVNAAETASNTQDQQSFQNADDRQRKNQERQQQAFFLRRQMQKAHSEQFELQSHPDELSISVRRGAVR